MTWRKIKSASSSGVAVLDQEPILGIRGDEIEVSRSLDEASSLTSGQQQVKEEAIAWFQSGKPKMRLLSGYAGVGKTFMLVNVVETLVNEGLLDWGQVIGVAPTHTAVGILKGATATRFADYKTLASLLSLRPSLVEWDMTQQQLLDQLLGIHEDDLEPDQAVMLESMLTLKKAADEMRVAFNPTKSMNVIGEAIADVRLIIVDEASMIDAIQFSLFNELIESSTVHPQLQVIFVGDPCQLPPIKESRSRCIEVEGFTQLDQVVRYSGPILDYCTQVRDGAFLDNLHYQMEHDESLILCSYADGIRLVSDCIRDGDEVRVMAATNDAVDTINLQLRTLVKQESQLFYEPGDVLITKSPIARDQYGACRPYPSKKNQVKIHVGTSALIRIDKIVSADTFTSHRGTVFEKLLVQATDLSLEMPIDELVHCVNPNQWMTWQEEQKEAFQMYMATRSRSRDKTKRGQEGKMAEIAWNYLGIKNWYQHTSGMEITPQEHQRHCKKLQSNSFGLKQFADEVTYSYASTVHRAQGAGYNIVLLDMNSLLRKQRGSSDDGGAWDTRKLLYTAATRARKQLVFLV
ncbi:MAG: AAA family ATPase [Cyanobacteria bacterium P01_A01_bin.37]